MKVYLSPSDQPGMGVGTYGTEGYRMQQLSNKVKAALIALGHDVYGSDNTLSLAQRVAASNAANVDVHIALHSNAGGGTGPEIWHYPNSTNGILLSNCIITEVANVQGCPPSRGLKSNSTYWDLLGTVAPAAILEVGFHDNAYDAQWIVNNMDDIAQAIAEGIDAY